MLRVTLVFALAACGAHHGRGRSDQPDPASQGLNGALAAPAPEEPVRDRAEAPVPAAAEDPVQPRRASPRVVAREGMERCGDVAWATVEVPAGGATTTPTGLRVAFDGSSHDNFADGTTDLVLHLTLGDAQRWLPSALAPPRAVVFLDHCLRVVDGGADRVVLEVAPVAP